MKIATILLSMILTSCASLDVDMLKRIAREKKVTLVDVDKDTSVVIRRDRDCHCAMIRYELKF